MRRCATTSTRPASRRHNDANVLSIGARIVAAELALDIVDVFLSTEFDGGRHARRLAEITEIEEEEARTSNAGS